MKTFLTLILAIGIGFVIFKNKPEKKLQVTSEKITLPTQVKKSVSPELVKKQPEPEKPSSQKQVQAVASQSRQYNDELTRWLNEADFRSKGEVVVGMKSEVLPSGHTVYTSVTENGQSYQAETDSDGTLVAEEIQFTDGRKLSKLYENGRVKALYFQQTREFAFSASYDEFGNQKDFILLKNGVRARSESF